MNPTRQLGTLKLVRTRDRTQVNLRLPPELHQRLILTARHLGWSRNSTIAVALMQFCGKVGPK